MPPPISFAIIARATAIGLAYFAAAAVTVLLTRFDGGVSHLWIASALLLAELSITPRSLWWPTLAACGIASFAVTVLFGFGLAAALPFALINLAEGIIGAALLRRMLRQTNYLESISGVAIFAIAAGGIAPALTGLGGAVLATWITGLPFATNWLAWFTAHALGTLTFAPILALVLRGEIERWRAAAATRLKIEAAGLMLMMIAVSWLVFAQSNLPLLFVPMLPLLIVTFRLGRPGAAASVVALTVVGGILTARGFGPVNLIGGSIGERSQFFQFYLAVTVMIVLPVAAELKHRKEIFHRLQESEARYKLITESATDMLITFGTDGTILYVSPSSHEIAGFDPAALVGHKGAEFIDPRDLATVYAKHLEALENPGITHNVEYRGPTGDGGTRWFEAHTRGIADEHGGPAGVVCAVRDISERKSLEERLSHAASTDPLTGLANRRTFDARLDASIAAGHGGCIAIFDLDHFKRVNDHHGHAVGDTVLENFADIARQVVRGGDLVARLGGEEFGVIVDGAGLDQTAQMCDRLRSAIAASRILTPAGVIFSVTVSAGVARFDRGTSRADLMNLADAALYRAKAEGRDRLAIAA